MSCDKIDLIAYLKNELPETEKREVEKHLEKCGSCQKLLQEFDDMSSWIKTLKKVEPAPGFIIRVKEAFLERYPYFEKRPNLIAKIFKYKPIYVPAWTISVIIHIIAITFLVVMFYNYRLAVLATRAPIASEPYSGELVHLPVTYTVEHDLINFLIRRQQESFRDQQRIKYKAEDTRQAVENAISWLAKMQKEDGSWGDRNKLLSTSLALLCFITEGNSHLWGRFKDTVDKGIKFITTYIQKPLSERYGYTVATVVLAEDYIVTGDIGIFVVWKKAMSSILADLTQEKWFAKYRPLELCWLAWCLRLATAIGYDVDEEYRKVVNTIRQIVSIIRWLPAKLVREESFEWFSLWFIEEPLRKKYASYLLRNYKHPDLPEVRMYATYAIFQIGNQLWQEWDKKNKEVILKTQQEDGKFLYKGTTDHLLSTIHSTSCLQVYYRYPKS